MNRGAWSTEMLVIWFAATLISTRITSLLTPERQGLIRV